MRVLLDTNVLIHREASNVVRDDIGVLFRWLDELKYAKCVHPDSVAEVGKHADPAVVRTLGVKFSSYHQLKSRAPESGAIKQLRADDRTPNDAIDTSLLAEVAADRVDILITEDRGIHRKAARIGIPTRVFTIDAFLEKVTAENPALADYKVLSVKKVLFGDLNVTDSFFDTFRADYPPFNSWFNRKSDETAYVCFADDGSIVAFLYLKREGPGEDYGDIEPAFRRASRLKIGTFKVVSNGFKLGERFLKIVFDNALQYGVDEIYVTAFRRTTDQDRLIFLLEEWGFVRWGTKSASNSAAEQVYVRDFRPQVDEHDPRRTFPYVSSKARKFIVPIYPAYHTELLPDSILNNESPRAFVENRPNRNALSKVYISRSIERGLGPGDIIVFYRTASGTGPAWYTSVATTIGLVQDVITGIKDLTTFQQTCRKRSVFSDEELAAHWNYNPRNRPFVVNFLFVYSLPRRPNLMELTESKVITNPPRGFESISDTSFNKLLEISNADPRFVVG
jgi:predicted nucleic acid-binding protein